MKLSPELNPNKIHIYHELKKRRIFVGELIYIPEQNIYQVTYDKKYMLSKTAISMGPHLSLLQQIHTSLPGKLFPFFVDRIPEQANPAYSDYCCSEGISVNETNKIILLGAIGRRGPSTFVFEKTYLSNFNVETIKEFRKELDLTQHDLALAFDLTPLTLQKIEAGDSADLKTMKLLELYLTFPEAALWQLKLSGGTLHVKALVRLLKYFRKQLIANTENHTASVNLQKKKEGLSDRIKLSPPKKTR